MKNFPKKHYEAILEEALNLRIRWIMLKQLMGHTQERVDCMNWHAASFFLYAISSMENANVSAVGRMMDTRRGVSSIPKLLNEIETNLTTKEESQHFKTLLTRWESLEKTCKPIVNRRKMVVAHRADIMTAPLVLVKDWDDSTNEISEFVLAVGRIFGGFHQRGFDEHWYKSEIERYGDANKLMELLEASPEWVAELKRRRALDAYMSSLRDSGS